MAPGRSLDDSGHPDPYDDRMPGLDIAVVTVPSAQILDVTGPLEVFSSATRLVPGAQYRTHVLSTSGGSVLASSGLSFGTTALTELSAPVDTLVVAGGRDMDEACRDLELLDHVHGWRGLPGGPPPSAPGRSS